MEIRLTADQEAFVRHAIESGRFHRAEDAVEEA
jgi:Arc/MetJ-type ribon-helix-helix transcriptional regulator